MLKMDAAAGSILTELGVAEPGDLALLDEEDLARLLPLLKKAPILTPFPHLTRGAQHNSRPWVGAEEKASTSPRALVQRAPTAERNNY